MEIYVFFLKLFLPTKINYVLSPNTCFPPSCRATDIERVVHFDVWILAEVTPVFVGVQDF